ncbi:MAG TPA: hypothetical protein VK074_06975 [Fodinibius sp.]|nr:hypothetical protein [Fodinibius sp.]
MLKQQKRTSFWILGIFLFASMGWSCSESATNTGNTEHEVNPPPSSPEKDIVAQDTLFEEVDSPTLSTRQKDFLSKIERGLWPTEVHLGRLSEQISTIIQKETPIELNIVPGQSVITTREKIKHLEDGAILWRGTLPGRRGYVLLTASESGVTGYLKNISDSLFYKFQPIGGEGNLHALFEAHDTQLID